MNLYKLSVGEAKKITKEFKNTEFGKRAYFVAMIPLVLCIFLSLMGLYLTILDDSNDSGTIVLTGAFISFGIACITSLQYYALVKDYIKPLDEKPTSQKN